MIKKILIALMIVVVALAVVACGGPAVDETLSGNNDDQTNPPEEHVHAYEEEITPATCTTAGKIVTKCACGDVQSETALPLAEHTQSAVDCEKDTVCTVCGTVLAEKTGHTITATEIVTAATCGSAGKEKGVCVVCAKIIETEIPATGHVVDAGAAIAAVDGGFKITCSSCSQTVTVKPQEPAFKLTFDADIATESVNDIGLSVFNPDKWTTEEINGSKALKLQPGVPRYINISDPSKLAALGTFVISFDYMSTKEAALDTDKASIFSILGNFYDGKQTSAGATSWGWFIKLIEANDVIATVNSTETNSANSIALKRNEVYKIQAVVVPTDKVAHMFVNGTYIGASQSGMIPVLATAAANNTSIRFGDGPDCGHVYDNFQIAALK